MTNPSGPDPRLLSDAQLADIRRVYWQGTEDPSPTIELLAHVAAQALTIKQLWEVNDRLLADLDARETENVRSRERIASLEPALKRIQKIVDLGYRDDWTPDQIAEQVQGLRTRFNAMCDRLQATVQKHHLGLGGEHIDELVCDALDKLLSGPTPPTEEPTDTQRLDWLARKEAAYHSGMLVVADSDGWAVGEAVGAGFNGWPEGEGVTLRDAIDAAMQSAPPTEEPT